MRNDRLAMWVLGAAAFLAVLVSIGLGVVPSDAAANPVESPPAAESTPPSDPQDSPDEEPQIAGRTDRRQT